VVIPDSDAWIDYLKNPGSVQGATLQRLIETDKAALVGIVATEVLRGTRTPERREQVRDVLFSADYVEMTLACWERAGTIAGELDAGGLPLPLPDSIIAAIALENDYEVLTRDKHFERIPGLRLHNPDGVADA
jgi:predicted nucleic acid-binding protein